MIAYITLKKMCIKKPEKAIWQRSLMWAITLTYDLTGKEQCKTNKFKKYFNCRFSL